MHFYFSSGYLFLLPYIFIYAFAVFFGLKVDLIKNVYIFLHLFNIIFLSLTCLKYKRLIKTNIVPILFFVVLLVILLFSGLYLEFPADPWSHYRRIFHWNFYEHVNDFKECKFKFAYLFYNSVVGNVDVGYRFMILNVIGSCAVLLLLYQYYKLARLEFNTTYSILCVMAVYIFLGTGFSLAKYNMIASKLISQIIVIGCARIVAYNLLVRKVNFNIRAVLLVLFSLFGILFSHFQGLLILCILLLAIGLKKLFEIYKRKALIFLLIFGIIILCIHYVSIIKLTNLRQLAFNFKDIFIQQGIYLFGGVKFWLLSESGREFESFAQKTFSYLGWHGLANLLISIYYIKKNKLFAWMTVCIFLLFLYPPTCFYIFASIFKIRGISIDDVLVAHRYWLSIPPLFCTILFFRFCYKKYFFKIIKFESIYVSLCFAFLLLYSFTNISNAFPNSFYSFTPIEKNLTLQDKTKMFETLLDKHKHVLDENIIIADAATEQFLYSNYKCKIYSDNLPFAKEPRRNAIIKNKPCFPDGKQLRKLINSNNKNFAYLIVKENPSNLPAFSLYGKYLNNWKFDIINNVIRKNNDIRILKRLEKRGYIKSKLSSDYFLYYYNEG